MLGTYEPRKGHRFLLAAFRRVLAEAPTAHLVICGYGYPEQVTEVREMVQALSLEANVHLESFRDDVRDLLHASTVLVVSSQSFESFGLTVVEAWAERLPVVATRVGGLPEVIGEDGGGFCLAADDVTGFADAIGRLLKDGALRADMGERGYRRFVGNFTAERMADQYAHLIRRA
jgi:glycosyltransferase involved in cell wall biosynthesis